MKKYSYVATFNVLVDDAIFKLRVRADSISEAEQIAYHYALKRDWIDTGSMEIRKGTLGRDSLGRIIETEVVEYAVG